MEPSIVIGLNAVIVAVTGEEPRILTVERAEHVIAGAHTDEPALPFGPLDPAGHRTLELGLRAWVREQTGLELGYAEQLYTFADRHRDPSERAGGPRMVSIAYLALVREGRVAGGGRARWRGVYEFLPWEDGRSGQPQLLEKAIAPVLARWVGEAEAGEQRRARRERADMVQGDRTASRRDGLAKRVASAVGRVARRIVLGDTIRDTGCTLRVFRREVLEALPLQFHGMHRFVPYCARLGGHRVVETPVAHRPRARGRSKYGLADRAGPGLRDLLAVRWMRARLRRPEISRGPEHRG